jgi:hypothetical protein
MTKELCVRISGRLDNEGKRLRFNVEDIFS